MQETFSSGYSVLTNNHHWLTRGSSDDQWVQWSQREELELISQIIPIKTMYQPPI